MKATNAFRLLAASAATLALIACGGGIDSPTESEAGADGTTGAAGESPAATDEGTADGGAPAGDAIVIEYATQHTENTPFSRATARWADLVEERTEGRVTVEIYYSASLLPAAEVLPGIMDGRADSGFVVDTMFQNELPLTTASSIPFDRTNGVAQARAYQELYDSNEEYRAEFEELGIHVLMFQPPGATVIGSRDEIASLDDLEGKNIRCLGYICDALQGVGANPVAIASTEIYEAMDRRTIDGWAAYPFMDIVATQFQEVTPYVTDPGIGTYIQAFSPINMDTWDSIGPEDQEALTELGSEYYDIMAEEMNTLEEETCAATTESGMTLAAMDEADVQEWRDAVHDDVYQTWVSQVSGVTSVDPETFYSDLMTAYESAVEESDFESLYTACMDGELGG